MGTRYNRTFYRPQRSCGKVMFLHLSVSHSVHRGRGVSVRETPWTETHQQRSPQTETPQTETPMDRDPPLYSNEQAVHILLKCILVNIVVNDLMQIKCTRYSQVTLITELVVSGTRCSQLNRLLILRAVEI